MFTFNNKIVWFAAACMVFLAHAFYYYPIVIDDAYISMRYAERLVEGKGLTWNDGEYVEGYSNLLWVLTLAFLKLLGIDCVASSRLIGLVSSFACMLAFMRAQTLQGFSNQSLAVGNLAFALIAPVAVWAVYGLEGSMVMALLAWAYVLSLPLLEEADKRRAASVGILLGLVAISRPEAPIFTVFIATGIVLFSKVSFQHNLASLMIVCAIPFGFFAAQVAFRLYYYGDWLPNSFHVKVAWTDKRLFDGLAYSFSALYTFIPLFVVMMVGGGLARRTSTSALFFRQTKYLLWLAVLWCALMAIGGGDVFPSYRHILPVVPVFILLTMLSLDVLYTLATPKQARLILLLLPILYAMQKSSDQNHLAKIDHSSAIASEMGKWLHRMFKEQQPLIANDMAGAIPFYSKLPSVDMLGLNDPNLGKRMNKNRGQGLIGHELFDAEYILSRAPDIILLSAGNGESPIHPFGYGFTEGSPFFARYKKVTVELPSYKATMWVRNDSKINAQLRNGVFTSY